MGSGHPVPFRVLSGASARRPLCPRGSQLPRHPDQHHCVWTAGSVSPPDPRRSAPARSCVCLGHTPAPEQRQRIQERRTGRVDGRPEGRGWTGGGGSVTLGDLPRQRGGAPGGAEDGPPQGDPGQRPMRKSRWASWRRDPNPNPNPGLGWAGFGGSPALGMLEGSRVCRQEAPGRARLEPEQQDPHLSGPRRRAAPSRLVRHLALIHPDPCRLYGPGRST